MEVSTVTEIRKISKWSPGLFIHNLMRKHMAFLEFSSEQFKYKHILRGMGES